MIGGISLSRQGKWRPGSPRPWPPACLTDFGKLVTSEGPGGSGSGNAVSPITHRDPRIVPLVTAIFRVALAFGVRLVWRDPADVWYWVRSVAFMLPLLIALPAHRDALLSSTARFPELNSGADRSSTWDYKPTEEDSNRPTTQMAAADKVYGTFRSRRDWARNPRPDPSLTPPTPMRIPCPPPCG